MTFAAIIQQSSIKHDHAISYDDTLCCDDHMMTHDAAWSWPLEWQRNPRGELVCEQLGTVWQISRQTFWGKSPTDAFGVPCFGVASLRAGLVNKWYLRHARKFKICGCIEIYVCTISPKFIFCIGCSSSKI